MNPNALGLCRTQALIEALEIVEEKANERGMVVWDHVLSAASVELRYRYKKEDAWYKLDKAGKVLRFKDSAHLVHYVVDRGKQLFEANFA